MGSVNLLQGLNHRLLCDHEAFLPSASIPILGILAQVSAQNDALLPYSE